MPLYQIDVVSTNNLVLGNYKMETSVYASTAGSFTWVNLGAGMLNGFTHEIEKYDAQAGNAPDPIEGIARETCKADWELMELDTSVLSVITCGAMTASSTGTVMTVIAGGNTTLTPRAFRFTNTRLVSGATKQTIITVFKATLDTGIAFTMKSDNDTDPIQVMPAAITGKIDRTRSTGTQLFTITKTI